MGARKFLVAYNIYFDSADVAMVRAIAREIRAASGGLKGVKAMGVLAHGRAQLSMNITDFDGHAALPGLSRGLGAGRCVTRQRPSRARSSA